MTIEKQKEGAALTLKIEGRLDTITSPELEAVLKTELGGIEDLTFDFSALDYLSSAGLRVLLSAQKQMNKQGKMKVTGVSEVILEIFEVTGFTDLLTIEPA